MGGPNIPQFMAKIIKNSINLGHMEGYIIKNSQIYPNFGHINSATAVTPPIIPQIYDIIMVYIAKIAIFNPYS